MDNLFIVESPLQALVAVELSFQCSGQRNGIVYRASGGLRERNDQQIAEVVRRGEWDLIRSISFRDSDPLARHFSIRKQVQKLRDEFAGTIDTLYFGEFRSQWMHLVRFSISPRKAVLIDDGAATLTVVRDYIDKGLFYPKEPWSLGSFVKALVKNCVYLGVTGKRDSKQPVLVASAFLKERSDYKVDFSWVRSQLGESAIGSAPPKEVLYFGSKYSEAGIVDRAYEIQFISNIKAYYEKRGLQLSYCSHRDESEEKIGKVEHQLGLKVLRPEVPAELFVLDRHEKVAEMAGAYSSVLNNLNIIFPDKKIRSFRLAEDEIRVDNRDRIGVIYRYLEEEGIPIVCRF